MVKKRVHVGRGLFFICFLSLSLSYFSSRWVRERVREVRRGRLGALSVARRKFVRCPEVCAQSAARRRMRPRIKIASHGERGAAGACADTTPIAPWTIPRPKVARGGNRHTFYLAAAPEILLTTIVWNKGMILQNKNKKKQNQSFTRRDIQKRLKNFEISVPLTRIELSSL